MKDLRKCSVSCKNGDCLREFKVKTLAEMRKTFWGKIPNREQRRVKIENILKRARQDFLRRCGNNEIDPTLHPNQLCFVIDGNIVCEKAYANAIGLADGRGMPTKTWKDELKLLTGKRNNSRRLLHVLENR